MLGGVPDPLPLENTRSGTDHPQRNRGPHGREGATEGSVAKALADDARLDRVDEAIQQGQLARAEELLTACARGSCVMALKQLALAYRREGLRDKAISVYKRLFRMSDDRFARDLLRQQIEELGGDVAD